MLIRFEELSPGSATRISFASMSLVVVFAPHSDDEQRVFRIFHGDHLRRIDVHTFGNRPWIRFSVTARICIVEGVTLRSSNALHFAWPRARTRRQSGAHVRRRVARIDASHVGDLLSAPSNHTRLHEPRILHHVASIQECALWFNAPRSEIRARDRLFFRDNTNVRNGEQGREHCACVTKMDWNGAGIDMLVWMRDLD